LQATPRQTVEKLKQEVWARNPQLVPQWQRLLLDDGTVLQEGQRVGELGLPRESAVVQLVFCVDAQYLLSASPSTRTEIARALHSMGEVAAPYVAKLFEDEDGGRLHQSKMLEVLQNICRTLGPEKDGSDFDNLRTALVPFAMELFEDYRLGRVQPVRHLHGDSDDEEDIGGLFGDSDDDEWMGGVGGGLSRPCLEVLKCLGKPAVPRMVWALFHHFPHELRRVIAQLPQGHCPDSVQAYYEARPKPASKKRGCGVSKASIKDFLSVKELMERDIRCATDDWREILEGFYRSLLATIAGLIERVEDLRARAAFQRALDKPPPPVLVVWC